MSRQCLDNCLDNEKDNVSTSLDHCFDNRLGGRDVNIENPVIIVLSLCDHIGGDKSLQSLNHCVLNYE